MRLIELLCHVIERGSHDRKQNVTEFDSFMFHDEYVLFRLFSPTQLNIAFGQMLRDAVRVLGNRGNHLPRPWTLASF